MKRRFRFGVLVGRAATLTEWQETARRAEDLGYSTLLVPDHFGPQLAPVPALVAAACSTTSLRLGTFVLDNDFRHPAAVAKEAATADLLTGGRFELGIGAGWNEADYVKAGLKFEPPAVRIARLEEALGIIKGLFQGGQVTFEGHYYQVRGLEGLPKPAQPGGPPILIGAAGRRMLGLVARHADILNFPDRPSVGVSTAGNPGLGLTMMEQIEIVRSAAGERYSRLELSSLTVPRITDQVAETIAGLARQMQTTAEIVTAMPGTLVGSLAAISDKLEEMRERYDISYPVIPGAAMQAVAPVVARLRDK